MSGSLVPYNVTSMHSFGPSSLACYLEADKLHREESDFIDYSIPGTRLVQRDGSIQVIPKSPAYIFGEKVIRPIIDGSYNVAKYIWTDLTRVASKIDSFFNILPGARAEKIEHRTSEKSAETCKKYNYLESLFDWYRSAGKCMPDSLLHFPSRRSIYAYLKKHHLTKDIDGRVLLFVSEIFKESTIEQFDREIQKMSIRWHLDANYNDCCSAERPLGGYMVNMHDPEFLKPDFRLICSNKGVIPYKLISNIKEALMDCAEGK